MNLSTWCRLARAGQFLILLALLASTSLISHADERTIPPAAELQPRVHLPLVVGGGADSPSAQELIAAALKAGRIDHGTSLLYRAYALFSDDRLPADLWGSGSEGEDQALFVEAADSSLPADVQAKLRPFLVRPDHPDSVHSAKLAAQPLRTSSSADGLCSSDGWASMTSLNPLVKVKVHTPCRGDYAADLQTALGMIESLWPPMTSLMGAPLPDRGGIDGGLSDDIDLYLLEPLGAIWRAGYSNEIGEGAVAVASPAAPYTGFRSSGYMLLARSDLAASSFKSSLAHEFFHVLQRAYNREIFFHGATEWWFVEASATWAEAYFVPETSGQEVHTRFEDPFQRTDDPLHRSAAPSDETQNQWEDQMYASYIWPFFMQQERGATAIGAAWQGIAAAGDDWERGLAAIDAQLPFATHFHRFAVRNLNSDFGGDNPLVRRYIDLDQQFPDGKMPKVRQDEHLPARRATDPPLSLPDRIPSLEAHYYHFTLDDAVRQVAFDFSKLAPHADRVVDAVVKIKGRPWELRELLPNQVRFCRDNPAQDLEQIWFIVSDHNTDIASKVAGSLEVRALEEPCGCGAEQIAALRSTAALTGTFSFAYEREGRGLVNGIDTSVAVQNAGLVTVQYTKPNPANFPLSWQSQAMDGTAQVLSTYVQHRASGQSGTLEGQGFVHPAGSGYNSPKSYLSVNGQQCTYSFVVIVGLTVTRTEFGSSNPVPLLFRFGVADIPLPGAGSVLTGAMTTVPVILGEIDISTGYRGAGFMGELEQVVGQGNLGQATLSWQIEPAAPPQATHRLSAPAP
jgi:hypothetical protein